jgi:protein-disulfide isomerase
MSMPSSVLVVLSLFVAAAPAVAETVATVGGTPITREQLESEVKPQLIEIDNQRYEVLKGGLDEIVATKLFELEAKKRGVTVEELVKVEVADKVPAPTDAAVQQLYDQNKAQLGQATLEQVKPRIVEFLNQLGAAERQGAFVEELKKSYPTTIALKAPKIEVADGGRPAKGKAGASIDIIMFSDYQCPYCARAEESVTQVLSKYGDKVRLVFRDYPLPFHDRARPAAEAAACANEQGKFWEYHDKLFAGQRDLSDAKLKAMAGELGLDQAKFDACLASGKFEAQIDEDMKAGEAVGVSGTPAFFINGRMLSGAQPFEAFQVIIDEELAASGS